jgi:multicomponent Na+:H+ antiporter subunit B
MLMSIEYLMLAAPDVALTEASIGAAVSTVLLLLGTFLVGAKEKRVKGRKILPFIATIAIAAMLIYASTSLPKFGSGESVAQNGVAEYYLKNNVSETGINNVVTSVLASYRGFDTFGETLIIFTAAIAVLMLLGRFSRNH